MHDTKLQQRFLSKIDKTGFCWNWTGYVKPNGYGTISKTGIIGRNEKLYAHRLSYEIKNGSIPEGLVIDHLCRNRKCVNPDHLEVVTQKENLLRGDTLPSRQAKQTHCIHGHEFSTTNTYLWRGHRKCKECTRKGKLRAYYKRKLI